MRRLSQFATQKGKAGKGPCGRISAGIRSPRTGRKPGRGEQQQPGQGAGVAPGRKAVRETRQPLLDGLEKGCDEYWILFSRQRRRRIERKRYEVSAGDGVATGMGRTTTTSRPFTSRCGPSIPRPPWKGRSAAATHRGPHPREGAAAGGAGLKQGGLCARACLVAVPGDSCFRRDRQARNQRNIPAAEIA